MKNKTQWQYCYICFIFILFVSNAHAVSFQSMKTETDSDADGTIDGIDYSIYDDCRPIENRSDNNADGIIDSITYMTYDTDKYTTIIRHDLDADGKIDQVLYFWEENSAGEERSITEEDLDGDGTIDSFQCYVYIDESSSAILKSYEGTGSYAGAGTLTGVTYYTKDANGNTVKEESDNDADNLIDEITYINYDENCVPILYEIDLDNDGKIDQVTQHTYDDKCRPLSSKVDSDLVSYGIQAISQQIYEMNYTDDVYGSPIKIETHTTMSQTIMGQTVNQEYAIIQYMTYEYAEGDCGPSTLCPSCTNIDQDSNGSDNVGVTQNQVAELYVATFNRAPDSAGLDYWVNDAFGGNATIEQIASSFFDQTETQLLYPPQNTDTEFVNSIYMNLFNRLPEAEGLAYWIGPGGLGGGMHRSVMIEALKNGATGSDRTILDNKTEAGLYCANKNITGINFSLANITDDVTTLEAAKEAIDDLESNMN